MAALRFSSPTEYISWCRARGLTPQLGKATPEPEPPKELKWKNKRVQYDGIWFDSLGECNRYQYLKKLQQWGLITNLRTHPKYTFDLNGFTLWSYKPDFDYTDVQTGLLVVEDFKNPVNAKKSDFRRNCLMMRARFGVNVKVVLNSKE